MSFTELDTPELRETLLAALDESGFAKDSCGVIGEEVTVSRLSLGEDDFPISLNLLGGTVTINSAPELYGHFVLRISPDEPIHIEEFERADLADDAFRPIKGRWLRHLRAIASNPNAR